MKAGTAAYGTELAKLATQPVYLARFFHVPTYAGGAAYPFSRDFATGAVLSPTSPKLVCMNAPTGNTQVIEQELGRSSIGAFTLSLVDQDGEILKHLSAPTLTLRQGLWPTDLEILVNESPTGLPATGTLEIETSGVIERIRYSSWDDATRTIHGSARGVDGTAAFGHLAGDPLTNGEQIRPGQRAQLFAGYAPLAEADYMPFVRMEVIGRKVTGALVQVQIQDIQRTLRQTIFLSATADAPLVLAGNPITLALQILTSTGTNGSNGPYDTLAAENGLGVPQALVDIDGMEALRDTHFPADVYDFSITGPEDGKAFLESQFWQTLNCYPLVTQDGRLTVRRFSQSDASVATLDASSIIAFDPQFTDAQLVNVVAFAYDWNLSSAPNAYGKRQIYSHVGAGSSIEKYGRRTTLEIQSKGIKTSAAAQTILDNRALGIMQRFAEPALVLVVDAFYRHHRIEAGDTVTLTHPLVPNPKTGARGMTGELFQVLDTTPMFGAHGRMRLTLLWTGGLPAIAPPSSNGAVQTPTNIIDHEPPAVPTGLAITPSGEVLVDGTFVPILDISWTPNTETDLSHYVVRWRQQSTVPYAYGIAGSSRLILRGLVLSANTTYEVSVSAVDAAGNASDYSTAFVITTTADPGAPAVPTGLVLTPYPLAVAATWNGPPEHDIGYWELQRADNSGFTVNVVTRQVQGTAFVDDVQDTTARYYRLRVVRRTMVASGWTAALSAAGQQVDSQHLHDLAVTVGKIADLAVARGNIQDLAVNSLKLSDYAVDTLKMAVGAVTRGDLVEDEGPILIGSFYPFEGQVVGLYFAVTDPNSVVLIDTWAWYVGNPGSGSTTFRFRRNGTLLKQYTLAGATSGIVSFCIRDAPGMDTHLYQVTADSGGTSPAQSSYNRIHVLECKR